MTKLSARRVYDGRVINVDIDTVRFPNGSVGELEMVRHPGASAVVPFLTDPHGDDPQILLIRQFRHAADGFIYEIPAGKIEGSEPPEACAKRELQEEAGCVAKTIEHVYTLYTTPGFTDEKIHVFMASGLSRVATEHEKDEFLTVETVTLSRALELVKTGDLTDAKTALALLFVAGFKLAR